jgi:hypothetical protein
LERPAKRAGRAGRLAVNSNVVRETQEIKDRALRNFAATSCQKSDLALRPVYHQKTERVEAHILVCFLALALWRTLEMWMRSKGLGTCARQLLLEVSTIRSMDVILPVKSRGQLRMRLVADQTSPSPNY